MSEKPSFWCSSFSRFWWWLLALLGLPLLLFLMNHFQQAKIENDLTTRVSAALSAENIDWAEVDVQQRGRDVLLKGEPGSDIERNRAQELVLGVYGVNRVDFAGDYLPAANEQNNEADQAAQASGDKDGVAEADQGSEDGTVAEPDDTAGADATDTATGQDAADGTEQAASAPDAGDAADKALLPAELMMTIEGDQLVLDGKMASQQQIDELQKEAALQFGVTKVVNNLKVDEGHAEAEWLSSVTKMMASLPAGGGVKINADTLELSGDVASDEELEKLSTQTQQVLQGSGLQLQNALQVVSKAEAESEQQAAAQAEECQNRLNTAMQDKEVLFTFNDSTINSQSNALLDDLAGIISECSGAMSGRVIVIGGHTDSVGKDAYNLELSQRRADSVRDYLKNKQIDETLLEAKGFGESQPVASNNTAAGQAKNRRITFEIKQK
jgi:outer membrane protein OmpA-like peptidoglycan-associated protein